MNWRANNKMIIFKNKSKSLIQKNLSQKNKNLYLNKKMN